VIVIRSGGTRGTARNGAAAERRGGARRCGARRYGARFPSRCTLTPAVKKKNPAHRNVERDSGDENHGFRHVKRRRARCGRCVGDGGAADPATPGRRIKSPAPRAISAMRQGADPIRSGAGRGCGFPRPSHNRPSTQSISPRIQNGGPISGVVQCSGHATSVVAAMSARPIHGAIRVDSSKNVIDGKTDGRAARFLRTGAVPVSTPLPRTRRRVGRRSTAQRPCSNHGDDLGFPTTIRTNG